MKIMTTHSSATALRRRAQLVLNDSSIHPQWRAIIRYALEIDDPWLADLVRRADAGEPIIDTIDKEKIEALAEIICRADEQSAAALFVLMSTLENSTSPQALANAAKHLAFTRCAESNVYGMVNAQIAVFEGELLADFVVS
jgi:hypothetical protein